MLAWLLSQWHSFRVAFWLAFERARDRHGDR